MGSHFPVYQIKIKLICRFKKSRDEALISISTIQELCIMLDYERRVLHFQDETLAQEINVMKA